ncbi:uncharacterized protein DUF1203 [Yoonia maritima]|uniref:Uncharacterized protein DUF1203 n=1 Tax=Yoonia maritima TaxID=1435347 RepID=A0A2T0W1U2_9RHOB|nr:uncharacterized protein DUF1203 [Yoonia maritima]
MFLSFLSCDADVVESLRAGGQDVYGNPAELTIYEGVGAPCRCCLDNVPYGKEMLICAARLFLHDCSLMLKPARFSCALIVACRLRETIVRRFLKYSPIFLVKAYNADQRIMYGTGQITESKMVAQYAQELFDRGDVSFVDVRSAKNNCFFTRIVTQE